MATRTPCRLCLLSMALLLIPSLLSAQPRFRIAAGSSQQELGGTQQDTGGLGGMNQDELGNPVLTSPLDENRPIDLDPSLFQRGDRSAIQLPGLPERDLTREPDQSMIVREKFAGWKQAGIEVDDLIVTDPLRSNWVLIDATGKLSGVVRGASSVQTTMLAVYLLERGKVRSKSWTDENGEFTFNNVPPGTYGLVGFGDNGFFAFGFNAIEHKASLRNRMPSRIEVTATQNKTTINLDWIRFFAANVEFRVLGRHVSEETSDGLAELYGIEGISTLSPASIPATSISSHEVELGEDGILVGRVHQINTLNGRPVDVRGARVLILKDDVVFAGTDADNYGIFRFKKIPPGDYSVVAVGPDGVGSIGIRGVTSATSSGTGISEQDRMAAEIESSENGANGTNLNARQSNDVRLAVDFSLLPVEGIGWLNDLATEEAYLRIMNRPRPPEIFKDDGANIPICYCNRNSAGKQFFRSISASFDLLFYGETFEPGFEQGGFNGCGGAGCNSCGYGYGGMPGPTCPGCMNPGCNSCHPSGGVHPGMMYPAPPCGGCGAVGCSHCQPVASPWVSGQMSPSGMVPPPVSTEGMMYEVEPVILPDGQPGIMPGQMQNR